MAYLHCWIWIPIPIPIWTARQMATLYYVEIFTLHGVGFKFQLQKWDQNRDQNWNPDL